MLVSDCEQHLPVLPGAVPLLHTDHQQGTGLPFFLNLNFQSSLGIKNIEFEVGALTLTFPLSECHHLPQLCPGSRCGRLRDQLRHRQSSPSHCHLQCLRQAGLGWS